MNIRNILILASTSAVALSLVGCSGGSTEDTKAPEGASYYKGDMKPRGGNGAAASKGAPAAATQ